MKPVRLNFLFVMPKLVQSIGDGYVFPLGIAYVSASMKKAGFQVFTLNLNHHNGEIEDILDTHIRENHIDVIATGGLSPQFHMIKNVIESARKIKSDIITILGGGIISADPHVAMETLAFADYGVIGEGEITICELGRALENNSPSADVDGIVFKHDNKFILTRPRKDIENLDDIPWPDYEGFDIEKYLEAPPAEFAGVSGNRMVCMLGSRSCPFKCTFCFHTNGYKYRQRSLDDFFAELDHLIAKYKIEYISLADELFAPNFSRAREFCERIKKYKIKWYADFRVDKITDELLALLKSSGLGSMFFGLESADNRILKSMRKGITIEQTEDTLAKVYKTGIPMFGCFIFGDIEETYETANNTLKWWREHPQYHVHLTLLKPFPGSYVYKYACEHKLIENPAQYLKDGCPQINISKMNDYEFADIVNQISQANEINKLNNLKLLELNPEMGRETFSGACSKCGTSQVWKNVKLFAIDYIHCGNCGQKYAIPCPPEIGANLDRNISRLLEKYGKVAIWGMTLSIMDLFKDSQTLHNPHVYPIDISDSKRQMNLYGRKILSPDVLNSDGVPVVIIAVPSHAGQISCQIKENHPGVTKILDICRLVEIYNQ